MSFKDKLKRKGWKRTLRKCSSPKKYRDTENHPAL